MEQQYSLAVAIVLRTRTYGVSIQQSGLGIVNRFSKPDGNSNGSPDSGQSAVIDILRNVNERSIHLAYAIKSSLQSLPNSQVDESISFLRCYSFKASPCYSCGVQPKGKKD